MTQPYTSAVYTPADEQSVRYVFEHTTRYAYPENAWDSFGILHLQPSTDHQHLLDYDLSLTPGAQTRVHLDYFGNTIHEFHVEALHEALTIHSRGIVEVTPLFARNLSMTVQDYQQQLPPHLAEYLLPSVHVPIGSWSAALGIKAPNFQQPITSFLEHLTQHLYHLLEYTPGATTVSTPLAEFVESRQGVCQDYAHLMIGVLREQGIPARYVSGYVYSADHEGWHGAQASHAWAEVYLPTIGWVGHDPTNGVPITNEHIVVATGRDYADVAPLKGVHKGGGPALLTVEVSVRKF